MKNLTLIFVFILIAVQTNATVRTLSGGGGGQYSDFNAAYNASSNGDTIMIQPYSGSYYAVAMDKSLVYIGVGFNATKMNSYRSVIQPANLCCGWRLMYTSASGSRFYGLEFSSGFQLSSENGQVSNVVFEDCKFASTITIGGNNGNGYGHANITFRNCIFEQDDGVNMTLDPVNSGITNGVFLTNCIFEGRIQTGSIGYVPTNVLIDHCLFLSSVTPIFNLTNLTIQNSIFMNCTSIQNFSPNNYVNNFARLVSMSSPNIGLTDPQFVNYSLGSFYSASHNYNVTNPAALTGATDGTQVGVNGGASSFNESGETLIIPIVRSMTINNTTVPPGGTIQVKVKATKPNGN